MQFLIGAFLVGHALVHAAYLSPAPPRTADGPEWPFEMARTWLVTGAVSYTHLTLPTILRV